MNDLLWYLTEAVWWGYRYRAMFGDGDGYGNGYCNSDGYGYGNGYCNGNGYGYGDTGDTTGYVTGCGEGNNTSSTGMSGAVIGYGHYVYRRKVCK